MTTWAEWKRLAEALDETRRRIQRLYDLAEAERIAAAEKDARPDTVTPTLEARP